MLIFLLQRHDPLYAAFLLVGVLGTFKAYPTLSDPGLFVSMIALFPETYPCKFISASFVLCLLAIYVSQISDTPS